MIEFGWRFGASVSVDSVEPRSSVSSSKTTRTTFCAGVSESSTSAARQRSLHEATKRFTTRKFTSASRSARRISRIATLMSSSVRRPLPLNRSNVS